MAEKPKQKTYADRASDPIYQAFLSWDKSANPNSPYTQEGSPLYDNEAQWASLQANGYPKDFSNFQRGTGGLVPTAPPQGGGGAGGGGAVGTSTAAGVAVPPPSARALSGYGSAGNTMNATAQATAEPLASQDAANPALGQRIYPQHLRYLAALSPRIY